jgi:hypothetical protein
MGYQVPPGIADATVPNPVFNLTPAATVDEGNNWINMSWGPLALTTPGNATLGNYALGAGSPAINAIPLVSVAGQLAPKSDYFGNPRPATPGTAVDIGAVEFVGGGGVVAPTLTSINPNSHARGGSGFTVTLRGTGLTGATAVDVSGSGVAVTNVTVVNVTTVTATFTIADGAQRSARDVTVTTPGGTSNAVTFTVTR